MDKLMSDIRLALCGFRRTPSFPIAVLLMLAPGIGTPTAMFKVFRTVLVEKLPIVAQDRVIIMHPLDCTVGISMCLRHISRRSRATAPSFVE
jgi:hypothetical protein